MVGRPGSRQIAELLRERILGGQLAVGERLPSEAELAEEFGVNRGTVREALRMLSSRLLLTTSRGVGGGSQVARIDPDRVAQLLEDSILQLTRSEGCTIVELLEAREMLEVPGARLAASRRTGPQLELLRAAIPSSLEDMGLSRVWQLNQRFHEVVLELADNRLLPILAQPVFHVIRTRFLRDRATMGFWRRVHVDHAAILAAIEAGDADQAGAEMADHLAHLRATYELIDRQSRLPA
jgi:GntR family transcriptional regulator, transcriptional repressor for pyruvate dehydrogenase complex